MGKQSSFKKYVAVKTSEDGKIVQNKRYNGRIVFEEDTWKLYLAKDRTFPLVLFKPWIEPKVDTPVKEDSDETYFDYEEEMRSRRY